MKKKIISIPLLLISYLCLNAQQENGTILLDDATSKTYVVTNAFLNASNDVHDLIQNVSPNPDFTTNNQTLVDTIVDVADVPDLSDYELKSELTNDVCNIVTNDGWFVTWKNLYDHESFFDNGITQVTEGLDGTLEIWVNNDVAFLTVTNGAAWPNANVYAGEVVEGGSGEPFGYIAMEWRNALGIAKKSDITNTVTKAYVESLGIESGVDAQTVTNMTTLTPVCSQTPTFSEWVLTGSNVGTGWRVVPEGYDQISGKYGWKLVDGDGVMIADTLVPFDATTLSFDGVDVTATRTRTDIIGYTLGAQTNSVLAATNAIISASITNGFVTASITNGLATASITNGLVTASVTNGLLGADAISTNNAAFVTAVTNCPVVIASADAEALTEWGIYGGGGTIGALLAALAAAVAALKKKKMPLYPVGGTGNPVNATYESGVLTISPFSMAAYTPTANAAFSVAMGALPSDMEAGKARDAVLVIDCTSLTEGQEPTVTWGASFHPRTDAGTDFACAAGVRNVYYVSEYAPGEFAVGGWAETEGGNT